MGGQRESTERCVEAAVWVAAKRAPTEIRRAGVWKSRQIIIRPLSGLLIKSLILITGLPKTIFPWTETALCSGSCISGCQNFSITAYVETTALRQHQCIVHRWRQCREQTLSPVTKRLAFLSTCRTKTHLWFPIWIYIFFYSLSLSLSVCLYAWCSLFLVFTLHNLIWHRLSSRCSFLFVFSTAMINAGCWKFLTISHGQNHLGSP